MELQPAMSKNNIAQPNKLLIITLAIILWLITVVLAIWDLLLIPEMVLRTLARFGAAADAFTLIHILLMFPLTVLVIAVSIGGFEYHRTRLGQPSSWRVFSRTLAVEFSILTLPLFI